MTQQQRYAVPVHSSSVLMLMTKNFIIKDFEQSCSVLNVHYRFLQKFDAADLSNGNSSE